MLKKSVREEQPVKLKIPADPSFIRLARLLIAGQLREKSVDEETIADLKLVISEILARAMAQDFVDEEVIIETQCSEVMKVSIGGFKKKIEIGELFDSKYLDHEAILGLVDRIKLKQAADNGFVLEVIKALSVE